MGEAAETVFVTPNGNGKENIVFHPAEMQVVELSGGLIEVHDPLFEQPYRFGDRSLVKDPEADDYVVAHWQHHGIHGSTRQLSNTEEYETKVGTGRWSRMQHMLTSAALTAYFNGTPAQVERMATHDVRHRKGSHLTDDLLAGRGKEDHHENDLFDFLTRNGFVTRLRGKGLIDDEGFLTRSGVHFSQVVDSKNQPHDFTNWPSSTGNLEAERLYILSEAAIWIYDTPTVREIMSHIYRDETSPQGDQLVIDDLESGLLLARAQIRCATENWGEKVSDIINELIIAFDRYLLTTRDQACVKYNQFYPGDTLHVLEEDWQQLRHQLITSEGQAFASGMHKIIATLVAQQRRAHLDFNNDSNIYSGPVLPDWLVIQESLGRSPHSQQRTVHQRSRNQNNEYLVLEMNQGKTRSIDPWIKLPGKDMARLSDLEPSIVDFRNQQAQWCSPTYDAIIDLSHSSLELTPTEKRAISIGLQKSEARWPEALQRPSMPAEELSKRFKTAGKRYRQIGALANREVGMAAKLAS